jgi:outer membrane receptor protein involved in Fe transport
VNRKLLQYDELINKAMKRILFGVLLLVSFTANSQNIKGKVYLGSNKEPAQFASIGLLQLPDSVIVSGVITLTDGAYIFEKVKPGTYFVKVSYQGYRSDGKNVTLQHGQNEVSVDTIFLTESADSISEVTVVGERMKGKELVDRTVYSIPAVVAKTSTTGYDLLKKIPQVNVDFQNNITLNGSSNFIIQVDGRQRDREYLAKLLPTDIESIEIISNPSGKYEGNIDGVINIILKKEARYGISGNAALSIKPFNKLTASGSGSLDYSAGKITFYLTGFSFVQNLEINSLNKGHYLANDSTTIQSGSGLIKVTNSSLNTGFDYYMNDKNNLSFNISFKPITQAIDIPGETFLYKNSNPQNTISSVTNEDLKSQESTASLFYKKSFNKAVQEFTAEVNYYWFNSNETNNFTNKRYLYNTDSMLNTYSRLEENLNQRNYFSTKLNYVQPLGMNAKFETGYQLYNQQLSYDFNINNQESTNLFKYSEFRNSVYAGVTYNLKKIGFQFMVRIENSQIRADSVTDPNYTFILPSVNLQYKFSASHNLKFTYNRRINRPGIYDMNPYYKVDQNYNITQGNPDLKPDYRDRLQLTYTWNFGSNYFSPYVYHEFFTNKIGMDYQVIHDTLTNTYRTFTKPYNLLNGYESGGGVNAMLWYVNINARIFKGHYNSYTGQSIVIPAVDYYSYSITSYAYAQFTKSKKTTAFVFLQYNGVNQNAQSKTYTMPFYGIGAQQQVKNHSFGIFWLLPFSTNVKLSRTETQTPYYTSTNTIGFNVANYIQFTYSYKFNKGKNVKKLDRKIEVESDSKSQGIGK